MSSKVFETFVNVEGVGTRSLRGMIEAIQEADDLTMWEADFAASMADSLRAWQGSTNWVTANQLAVIERIYKKLYDAGVV